jgi:hypothetical protein
MSGSRVSAEAVARNREKSRQRAAALRASNPDEANKKIQAWREANRQQDRDNHNLRYGVKVQQFVTRPFIFWDGEGYNEWKLNDDPRCLLDGKWKHRYMLFGCSHFPNDPLVGKDLGTVECLDYILSTERRFPDAFHVGFAFDYDVNMILKDVPKRLLKHLGVYGVVHWQGYRIEYIPRKWFSITRKDANGQKISATIWDVFGFYLSKYTTALAKHGIATRQQIDDIIEGKDRRGTFTYAQIEYVKSYWQKEVALGPPLMDKMREDCYDNGLFITQWHGSGALASYLLRKRRVNEWHSKDVPYDAMVAIRTGYAGGRFHPFRCGLHAGPVYTADINSAYIYACSLLPRLDNGRWRRLRGNEIDRANLGRFAIYHISYFADRDRAKAKDNMRRGAFGEIYPLFHRNQRHRIYWPRRVDGWFWSPEASTVANNPDAEFVEAWVYDDDGTYPFEWVNDEFNKRLNLQHEGNPAEKTLKWALAAMYGAMARRVGWDRKTRTAPKSHELAWAGFITSWCRAEMYKLGYEVWRRGGLISIDTDGVTSTVPISPEWLPRGVGEKLGQWKLEEFAGILYWQSGVYWLKDRDGNWTTAKTRGIKRGSLPVEAGLAALANSNFSSRPIVYPTIRTTRERFIGFKQAISSHNFDQWRTWEKVPTETIMGRGGSTVHAPVFCKKCRAPSANMMHVLTQVTPPTWINEPHYLPWIDEPVHRISTNQVDIDEADLFEIHRDSEIADRL